MWYLTVHQSHIPTPFFETNISSILDFYKLSTPRLE
jgi:hypothetical protein